MLSRARLLTVALATVVVAAVAVASASATTGTTTAGGFTVTASLSPDTVSKGQTVVQTASVKNVSNSVENVRVRIISPLASAAPGTFSVALQPSATFTKSASFPAALLKHGSHTLTVIALNVKTNATAQATASVTVN
jgi:uncharacterized protein (DUF58 family)